MKSISAPPKLLPLIGVAIVALVSGRLLAAGRAPGAAIEIYPGDSFENAVENLNPGDTLIVHQGIYADTGRISIAVQGTEQDPVLITGAEGENPPHITRPGSAAAQNTLNIEGATHLTIRGLEISSNGGDGVNLNSNPSYITLEDLRIHDVTVGVNFRSDMHHITVRRNHIHHIGEGGYTGEGMYVGCNYATCAVHSSLIENNWIHDTLGASQGDGIEIKRGSHSNIVRDNVIYDTHYPCILLYGTEGNPVNTVEGNVMWNCGDSGIQVAADAVIRNNIILESPANGLNSQDHQEVTPQNITFVHNTIVGGDPCLRMHNWSNQPNMVFANNAVYCPSGNYKIFGLDGVTVSGNVVTPATSSIPSSGYSEGRSTLLDFVNAAGRNVYPSADSALLDAGNPIYATATDFNGTPRNGTPEAGAYTWTGTNNPGWTIQEGFKPAEGPPAVTLQGIPGNESINLRWRVTGTTLPPTSTWQISYDGPVGIPPSPITNITSSLSSFALTNLTNYQWYTVTLTLENPPDLSDTVKVMPTDRFVYLPAVMRD